MVSARCIACRRNVSLLSEVRVARKGYVSVFHVCEKCFEMLRSDCMTLSAVGEVIHPSPARVRSWIFRFKCWLFEATFRYLRRNGKCE